MLSDEEAKTLGAQVEALKRRVRLSNILAIGALAVALAGGTAWAASRYLITSTKQIKPDVLTQIERASKGARGTNGAQGPQGEQGPQGDQGPQGATGSGGSTAAYTASASYVSLPGNGPPTTGVSLALSPGNYVVEGHVQVLVFGGDEAEGPCSLVDTPTGGTATVIDSEEWEAVTDFVSETETLEPNTGFADLPFSGEVNEAHSASTLSITCRAYYPVSNGQSLVSIMTDAVVTAIQTSPSG